MRQARPSPVQARALEGRSRVVRCLPAFDQRFCRSAVRPVWGLAFGPGPTLKGASRALCTRSARTGFDLRVHRALEKRPRDVLCLPSVDQRFYRPAARPVRGLAFGPGQILNRASGAVCTRSARGGFALRVLSGAKNGAPGRTRTSDPRLRRPMLYPAELRERERLLTGRWRFSLTV